MVSIRICRKGPYCPDRAAKAASVRRYLISNSLGIFVSLLLRKAGSPHPSRPLAVPPSPEGKALGKAFGASRGREGKGAASGPFSVLYIEEFSNARGIIRRKGRRGRDIMAAANGKGVYE